MKRFFAILLTAIFCISLAFAAETENVAAGNAAAQSSSTSTDAGSDSGTEDGGEENADAQNPDENSDEDGDESGETAPADETKDEDEGPTDDEAPSALNEDSQSASLSFNSIASTLRNNNLTIKANKETLKGLDVMSTDNAEILLYISKQPLLAIQATLDDAYDDLQATSELEFSAFQAILNTIKATRAIIDKDLDAIDRQIKSLSDSDDIKDSYNLASKQFEYAEHQMVMGAQTLFITVKSLEVQQADLERTFATLNRTVAEMEKRYELGQISEIDLLTVKNQQKQLDSGMQTLALQIENLTRDIASLVGFPPSTNLTLNAMPTVTAPTRNLQTDQSEVIKNSYTLYFKNDDVRKASNDYADNITYTLHTFEAAKYAYQAAESELIYSFRKLYTDIDEKQRLLTLARENEAFQQRLYDIADVQYSRGMISRNELLTARDELETVKSDTKKAEVELFTAVNTYNWALKGVI